MTITKVSAALVDLDGGVVINESSADADFRVESNGNTHMLFVDGGNDCVSIGASTDLTGALNITHGSEFGLVTSGGYNFQAKFESTDAEAAIVIEDSNSGTDYNRIGVITNDMAFTTNNSERMRIDSSGNVGIRNSSPSSLNSLGGNSLVIGDGTQNNNLFLYSATTGGTVGYGHIAFADSNANGSSAQYAGLIQYYHGDNSMAFYTGSAKRMTIDSSGNLGIGTTSPSAILEVVDAGASAPGTALKVYSNQNSAASDGLVFIHSEQSAAPFTALNVKQEGTAGGITSSCTNSSFTGVSIDAAATRNTANASYRLYQGQRTGTAVVFSVNDAGNVQNTNNSFTGLSDQRLKTNIADAGSQWDDIKALKVRTYQWGMGNTGHTQLGVISQEVEAAGMNGLVEESPADEYHIAYNSSLEGENIKSVKYSVLYMKAVKALQEAMTKIEALEARVTTLEG